MGSHYSELQEYSKCMLRTYTSVIRNKLTTEPSYIEDASLNVVDQLVDDITLEVVAEFHRAIIKGYVDQIFPGKVDENCDPGALTAECSTSNEQSERKVEDIKCPNCTHPVNASRFAPHLQKCMRIGRSSSRIASRRIASNSKETNYLGLSDDEDDEDWNAGAKKSNKIFKKIEPKKKKDCIKKSNKLGKESKLGKGENRNNKDDCLEWLITPKLQLSPSSANRIRKGIQDLDAETEDNSTTPSPADSNSTSSGSVSRRKDRVKLKGKLSKNYRYSEDSDATVTIH